MLRRAGLFVVILLIASAPVLKADITWGYNALGGQGLETLGLGISSGWAVSLYLDTATNGWGASYTLGADDVDSGVVTYITDSRGADLYWGSSFAVGGDASTDQQVFSVIWDSGTVGVGNYIIVDNVGASLYMTPGDSTGGGVGSYLQNSGVSGGWQAVPEPTTMALFGLGLGTAAVASRRRRRRDLEK